MCYSMNRFSTNHEMADVVDKRYLNIHYKELSSGTWCTIRRESLDDCVSCFAFSLFYFFLPSFNNGTLQLINDICIRLLYPPPPLNTFRGGGGGGGEDVFWRHQTIRAGRQAVGLLVKICVLTLIQCSNRLH